MCRGTDSDRAPGSCHLWADRLNMLMVSIVNLHKTLRFFLPYAMCLLKTLKVVIIHVVHLIYNINVCDKIEDLILLSKTNYLTLSY